MARDGGGPGYRYVHVLRHAKAVADADGGDHARRLNDRGRRDAAALGQRLSGAPGVLGFSGPDGEAVPPFDLVLCSTAARTTDTAERVLAALAAPPPVRRLKSLYGASVDSAVKLVREVDDEARSLVLVGHNPTAFTLTWELLSGDGAGNGEGSDRDRIEHHGFATCTLATVALPAASWSDVSTGTGTLCGVVSPPY